MFSSEMCCPWIKKKKGKSKLMPTAATTEDCSSARHSNGDEQLEPEGMWALNSTYLGVRAGEGDDITRAESRQ